MQLCTWYMQDVQKTDGVKEITSPSSIIDIKSSLLQQIRDKVCSALLIEKNRYVILHELILLLLYYAPDTLPYIKGNVDHLWI